jgi:hypothetical protein
LKVNTKRERHSANNKSPNNNNNNNNNTSKQPFVTLGALVTGLTSTQMSDEMNSADTLILPPTSFELNGNHSPSKLLKHENANGHDQTNLSETLDEQSTISSSSHLDHTVDSGLSSEMTNPELEKTIGSGGGGDDELSSTSSTLPHTTDHQRESSPTSGVIIPEEKRVTDRVKVFEAVANNDQSAMKKQAIKNGNQKKSLTSSSFSMGDHKQISPSSTESFDTLSMNETKAKNKSKKPSLKKQIQNLLKIDKTSTQEEFISVDEQKKTKRDNSKIKFFRLLFFCLTDESSFRFNNIYT